MKFDANKDKALFADSDDDDDEAAAGSKSKTKTKKKSSNEPFAASVLFKEGRTLHTSLHYVDYSKRPNQGTGAQ